MRSISVLGLSLASTLVLAADLPGSHDLPLVPRLTDAQIVDYRPEVEQERVYPLGSIRRISGQLRFDGQVNARGKLTAITYQLPAERTSNEAFTLAREALQKQGAELLFWCQARDCGESSLWANEVFGNAKLFGADEQQAYLLLRLAAPQDNSLVACTASPGVTAGPTCMWSSSTPARRWGTCYPLRPPCCASSRTPASWTCRNSPSPSPPGSTCCPAG